MPGRMGGETVTVHSLKVIKIDTENDLIYLKGHVPGTISFISKSTIIRCG